MKALFSSKHKYSQASMMRSSSKSGIFCTFSTTSSKHTLLLVSVNASAIRLISAAITLIICSKTSQVRLRFDGCSECDCDDEGLALVCSDEPCTSSLASSSWLSSALGNTGAGVSACSS
ncbi:hypothetical protein V8G54_032529 [Vigna mungo]|uniref:Uncharacterized protein n=1 Tax=Vigna mungo TaxID=3915 RepID=A0AAQ3MM36_VIGMU